MLLGNHFLPGQNFLILARGHYMLILMKIDSSSASLGSNGQRRSLDLKVCICTIHDGVPYKMVWFHESKGGVFVGLYGVTGETHFSYHADGKRHSKMKGIKKAIAEHQSTPIATITPFSQIISQALSTKPQDLAALAKSYDGHEKSDVQIFLNPTLFSSAFVLHLNFWIVDINSQSRFLTSIHNSTSNNRWSLVSLQAFCLRHFPSKQVAFSFVRHEQQ